MTESHPGSDVHNLPPSFYSGDQGFQDRCAKYTETSINADTSEN